VGSIASALLLAACSGGGSSATAEESAASTRSSDSLIALSLIAKGAERTRAEALQAHEKIALYQIPLADSSLTDQLNTIFLDSATTLLKPDEDGVGAPRLASDMLARVAEPMTQKQAQTSKTLRSRVDRQNEKIHAEAEKLAAQLMVQQRKDYAKKLEETYLDKGMDVTVTTKGKNATTLRLEWILVSRVVAHQFAKSDIWSTLREAGFKRLEITDGYDEEWYWTLN
jgi:hypothetical protein